MARYSGVFDIAEEAIIVVVLINRSLCFNKRSFRLKTKSKTQGRLTDTTRSPKTFYMFCLQITSKLYKYLRLRRKVRLVPRTDPEHRVGMNMNFNCNWRFFSLCLLFHIAPAKHCLRWKENQKPWQYQERAFGPVSEWDNQINEMFSIVIGPCAICLVTFFLSRSPEHSWQHPPEEKMRLVYAWFLPCWGLEQVQPQVQVTHICVVHWFFSCTSAKGYHIEVWNRTYLENLLWLVLEWLGHGWFYQCLENSQ